ncbi:MAG: ferrochelatase [Myxococcota bacterium]
MNATAPAAASVPQPAGRRGVVLVNVGTPDSPAVPDVRRYLAEFLSDPKVVDLPAPARWLLLNAIILPFRPKRSAHAYQQIWTSEGSPLLLHSKAQAAELQKLLPEFEVALAMRYGNPSLPAVLEGLRQRGVTELTVVPMYPQQASATVGTTVERVEQLGEGLKLAFVPPFFSREGFIEAQAEKVREVVKAIDAEHVLFSYHGVPVRQLKPACEGYCGAATPCAPLNTRNAHCYRAQCFATSAALQKASGAPGSSTAFQSRLKGATWIGPFTDEAIVALAQRGVKRLAVACPAFVADCLETLEEIGQRGAEAFKAAGGEHFALVPAVNAAPRFISMLAEEVRRTAR